VCEVFVHIPGEGTPNLFVSALPDPSSGGAAAGMAAWSTTSAPAIAARLLGEMTELLPELESTDKNLSVVHKPALVDAKGTGAWMEYRTSTRPAAPTTVSRRLYMLPGKDHVVKVELALTAGSEGSLKDLWSSFSSLKYAR
jgi:hypothetical protein